MSIRPSDTEYTVAGRGLFAATVTRIDLHHLGMQRGRESHPRFAHAWQTDKRDSFFFSTVPRARVRWRGVELADSHVALMTRDQPYWFSMDGPPQWGSMSLPTGYLESVSVAMSGRSLTLPRDGLTANSTPASHAKLLRLHAAAGYLAEHAPEIIRHSEAARGLEEALIEALCDCMDGSTLHSSSATWRNHSAIMGRFRAALETNVDHPLYVPELCHAIGVPERTLRKHCQEHLGMSPKRYLLLRRMNMAHHALRAADRSATTVTEIATRFGFWELGRFAVEYRAWCGESPSASLNRD